MLRVGADPAPGHRRGRPVDRLAVGASPTCRSIPSRAAGDRRAAAAAARHRRRPPRVWQPQLLDVEPVGEGGDQRHVRGRLGEAEMAVHLGRAFEQCLERVPAERQRRGNADRAPQRIAPADALAELAGCGFRRCPASTAASGLAVTAITRPSGSATPASAQPVAAPPRGWSAFRAVVKVFDATTTSVVAGSSGSTASSNAAPSMFDRKRTLSAPTSPAERVDQQRRARAPTRRCRCGGRR